MKKLIKRIIIVKYTMLSQFLAVKARLEKQFKSAILLFKSNSAAEFEITI